MGVEQHHIQFLSHRIGLVCLRLVSLVVFVLVSRILPQIAGNLPASRIGVMV